MSSEQYNSILSSMLKQKHSLAKLREELKEEEESYVSIVRNSNT